MKLFFSLSLLLALLSGCASTWNGIKEDTNAINDWTKQKINGGATYVQEKTQ